MTSSCLLSPGRPKQGIIVWLLAWVEKLLADGRKHSFYMRLRGTPCFCQLTGHSSRPCRFPIGNGSGCAHPCPAEMLRIKPGQSLQGTTWTLAAGFPPGPGSAGVCPLLGWPGARWSRASAFCHLSGQGATARGKPFYLVSATHVSRTVCLRRQVE